MRGWPCTSTIDTITGWRGWINNWIIWISSPQWNVLLFVYLIVHLQGLLFLLFAKHISFGYSKYCNLWSGTFSCCGLLAEIWNCKGLEGRGGKSELWHNYRVYVLHMIACGHYKLYRQFDSCYFCSYSVYFDFTQNITWKTVLSITMSNNKCQTVEYITDNLAKTAKAVFCKLVLKLQKRYKLCNTHNDINCNNVLMPFHQPGTGR